MRIEVPQGCALAECVNGATLARIHYTADPLKRPPQYNVVAERRAKGVKEWDRQMEMSEDVYDGLPVFADYCDELTCREALEPSAGGMLFGGWDCGQTLIPAFTLTELSKTFQVRTLLEVVSEGSESMEEFAPRVASALIDLLGDRWEDVQHWADATVDTRNGANKETAAQVARRVCGFALKGASNVWAGRYAAVSWLCRDMIDESTPRYVLDGSRCPVLHQGFKGAYKYNISKMGDQKGPGMVVNDPLKNAFSHVHDSLQYPAMEIKRIVDGRKSASQGKLSRPGVRMY